MCLWLSWSQAWKYERQVEALQQEASVHAQDIERRDEEVRAGNGRRVVVGARADSQLGVVSPAC